MRGLEAFLAPGRALAGTAEAIPLAEASVDAVTVADAFHWFDAQAALGEIARVLRPRGGLAVLITTPDWSDAPWAHEMGELLLQLRPEHPQFDGPPWHEAVRAAGGWSEPREVRVTFPQPSDPQRIADWMSSISWVAAMPDAQRAETAARGEPARGRRDPGAVAAAGDGRARAAPLSASVAITAWLRARRRAASPPSARDRPGAARAA